MKAIYKILCCVLIVCVALSFTSCASTDVDLKDGEYRVAMITDGGEITDQSFNQATYEACKAYCDEHKIKMTYKKPDGKFTNSFVAMIDSAIMEGYNVIVTSGYTFAEALCDVTKLYPNVKFICLDLGKADIVSAGVGYGYDNNPDNWNVADYYNTQNTYCAVYKEEIAGFMAGYAAVKLGYEKLGFLGGISVPPVIRYGYGYVQGIDTAAKELGITDKVSLEYAYGGQFYGSTEISAVMSTWYQGGTQVVFPCGGGIYTSACEAGAKVNAKIIGVDVDQSALIDSTYGDKMTLTSAMKNLEATVATLLDAIIYNGTWDQFAGRMDNLGLVSYENLSSNYVKIADTTQFGQGFTQDDYKALVKDIYDGKIVIDSSTDKEPNVSIKVNYRQGTIM